MATTAKDPLNEIAYWKNQYESAKASGNTAGTTYAQNQAKQYYDQIGQSNPNEASSISGMSAEQLKQYRDQKAGTTNYGGTTPAPTTNTGGVQDTGNIEDPNAPSIGGIPPEFQKYLDAFNQQQSGQQSATDALMKQLMDIMNGQALNQQGLKDEADKAAAAQAQEQKAAYQRLIDSLINNQSAELEGVNSNLANSRQDLQDTSFQQYLQSRQGIANRGLAGSGLANAQDTQLLLSNGRQLASLGRDAQSKLSGIQANYGNKLADANAQLSGVNQNKISQDIYNQLFQQGSSALNDKAKIYADLIGKTIGYDKISAGDAAANQFKYDQLDVENKQFYDKLGADQKLDYEKMNQSDRQFYAKLDNDSRQFYDKLKTDYNIELTKVMGTDANGKPTLDYLKLAEEIRRNKADNQLGYDKLSADVANWTSQNNLDMARIGVSRDTLNQKISYDNAMIDKASASAQNASDKFVLDGLKAQLASSANVIKSKQAALKEGQTLAADDKDVANYNRIMDRISGLINPKGGDSGSTASSNNNSNNSGSSGSYSNYYKSAKFDSNDPKVKTAEKAISDAVKLNGMPPSWVKPIMELVARESSLDPTAANPSSSAKGLFQFLDGTRANYGGNKVDWNDPYQQSVAGVKYIMDRYGTPEKALAFWDKNHYY